MTRELDRLLGRGSGGGHTESGGSSGGPSGITIMLAIVVLLILGGMFFGACLTIVPAGHVGVKDTFGIVDADVFQPGLHLKNPFTAVRM